MSYNSLPLRCIYRENGHVEPIVLFTSTCRHTGIIGKYLLYYYLFDIYTGRVPQIEPIVLFTSTCRLTGAIGKYLLY